ncbi:glycosyltransferase family 4 protein [Ruminococcus albus]|uniref:Phospho-N-acetylmuramoyl-pentapeptide-transferase n=1 Tax=Ruminococcus albus TaxID=1264 RepID=A0A1I1DF24_RUMAL|nr:hypothetical protein [Ruminococcus albus]SFB71370.1 phospho-N-acetylmuramoyl-pentapeptide-transferase [Ruminococcus albus]
MKLSFIIFALQLAVGGLLGRLFIPVFRKMKTGKMEIYIGDRFKQDGSEPRGGGALMLFCFVTACFAAAAAEGFNANEIKAAAFTAIFAAVLTAVGLMEDYDRDVRGGIGMKSRYRVTIKLLLCGGYTALMGLFGYSCKLVLLPFRWGYVDLGWAYIPLNALLMTVIITAAEICDCQKGIHETGVDGLYPMTMFVSFLGLFAAFGDGSREVVRVICLCAAGSCAGYLIWGAKPSKLFLGQSGGLFLGSVMCGILMISGLHGAVLLAMAVPFIELAAHILQRAVFKRNKKLLFKGATLHEHLRNIGWSEYRITAAYAAVQALFCAGAAAYSIYESRLVIN